MSYLVLARKYRPQSFEDLVGQSHVARTLANAIAQGRVAHAFLFTGVRGVGKTTSARLLAKCLNCLGPDGKATGPTATPCQVCAACKEIAAGSDMDVQEIDGASYNGVDEVRKLQEGLAFRPARDRFKIYIVDEVHMLSNAAWNAFLKTLEEPPPHVKFIFATTEVHKVPVTILSRCQRYDFKLISTQMIAKRLKEVLANESISAEDGAIAVLAREAAGSMRDAMSLLDQVIAFSGDKLAADDVARVLGVADRKILHELASALVGGDAATAVKVVDRLAQQGFDLSHVAKDILQHLRNLVVARVCGDDAAALLDLADEETGDVKELAAKSDVDDLTRLHGGFSRAFDDIVRSAHPRQALEVALVRLARRPALLPLDELLARLGELEKRLATGAPPPQGPRGGGSDLSRARGSASGAPGGGSSPAMFAPPSAPPQWEPPADRTRGSLALARPAEASPESAKIVAPPPVQAPPKTEPPKPAEASKPELPPQARLVRPTNLDDWRAILGKIRATNATVAAVFASASPLEVTKERVLLGFQLNSFEANQASEPEAMDLLHREARAHFGTDTKVALDVSLRGTSIASVQQIDADDRRERLAQARAQIEQHPLVRKAVALFGAEIRDVRLPGGEE